MAAPTKPFPWNCGQCGSRAVVSNVASYSLEMEHDGRSYTVTLPALQTPRCEACGEVVLTDDANHEISLAFRQQIGLLTPQQIRGNREQLGKTQRDLAATHSRWETGAQIQQRAMDRLLRLFFALPDVRSALANTSGLAALGASAVST